MVALSDPLLAQLAERLATKHISALEPLPGGASSLTYLARCVDRQVVVKVAPPGVPPIAHRDVLRHRRRKHADPNLEAMASASPQLLSRVRQLLG